MPLPAYPKNRDSPRDVDATQRPDAWRLETYMQALLEFVMSEDWDTYEQAIELQVLMRVATARMVQ